MFKVYKASAGSGKTTSLVAEYLSLCLLNPKKFRHILAVTFTNNATAEMKDRIVKTLTTFAFVSPSSLKETEKVIYDILKEIPDFKNITLLQNYSSSTGGQWTQVSINLPNPSSNYQIAFEAMGVNGAGLILDDIMVSGTPITDFTITASAGNHGQISPSGNVVVPLHNNQTFTLTPDQGYTVDELLVDGISQQRALIYTFENVIAEHTIAASFRTANPTLSTSPTVLYFSTSGGETPAKTINVIVGDFVSVDDILVQVEEPFLVSNDQSNYGLQTTIPYNGGMVYVVFAPPVGGTYTKTMTITNQTNTATVALNGVSTGIEEQKLENIQLYPNPAGDVLNLIFKENDLPEVIEILDVCGRTVLTQHVVDGNITINISGLQAGVYFVRANDIVKKFIKK